ATPPAAQGAQQSSLAGMSALIAAHPGLLGVLQLFGGLFLAWLGTQSVRSGVRARRAPSHIVATEDSPAAPVADTEMPAHAFRLGLYTNLSNPKALVFFGAVFAQFIRPEMSIAWTFAVGIWLLALSTAWFVIVTFIVRGFSTWLAVLAAYRCPRWSNLHYFGSGDGLRGHCPSALVGSIGLMIFTTTNNVEGREIDTYIRIIAGETVAGINFLKDIGASF